MYFRFWFSGLCLFCYRVFEAHLFLFYWLLFSHLHTFPSLFLSFYFFLKLFLFLYTLFFTLNAHTCTCMHTYIYIPLYFYAILKFILLTLIFTALETYTVLLLYNITLIIVKEQMIRKLEQSQSLEHKGVYYSKDKTNVYF